MAHKEQTESASDKPDLAEDLRNAQQARDELFDRLARLTADFQNSRRRWKRRRSSACNMPTAR